MRDRQEHGRNKRATVWASVAVVALLLALALIPSGSQEPSRDVGSVTVVAERTQQVADDVVYLPVQLDGRWALPGPGSWLQPVLSDTSTPFRLAYPCTVLDPSLIPGIRAFMTHQISLTFTGHEEALMLSTLGQRLSRADSVTCNEAGGTVVTGPPGPILDRLAVSDVAITGSRAVVKGQVRVIDWQSGVSHTPASGGGRLVNWSRVPGLLDSTISLNKGDDGRWRVTGFTWAFAPGRGP